MPVELFNSYYALNYLSPFTHDFEAERDGLLIAETFNQRRKKQLNSYDILPYLKPGTPYWLSDKTVTTAKSMIRTAESLAKITGQPPKVDFIYRLISEEISIEQEANLPDLLKISELKALLPNK